MRWRVTILLVASLSTAAYAEPLTPISELVRMPAAFEGHFVSISGTVSSLVERKSAVRYRGHENPYDVLVVCDRQACIDADLGLGGMPIKRGMLVDLHGRFARLAHVGPYVDRNELRVDRLTGHLPQVH